MQPSDRPLTERYDVALLDLDGVVYLGEQVIEGVPDALAAARDAGMRLAFVTNNASRTPVQVAELLTRLGVSADPSEVITSSHAAAHYLADRLPAGAPVLVLGTTGLIEAITERGLTPVSSADDEPQAVVQGYSPDLDWHALAEGMVAIRSGAPWVATNLDPTVPSPRGPLPGNGSLVAALAHATGTRPIATGKPDPTMHAESVQRSSAERPLVVGDRLDTDIEGAFRVGCDALLVLTGVTHPADLLSAPPEHRPAYLGRDASALNIAHPEVELAAGAARCRTAAVRIEPGALTLTQNASGDAGEAGDAGDAASGDGLDALRCLAVAAWQVLDTTGDAPAVRAGDAWAADALHHLGLAGSIESDESDESGDAADESDRDSSAGTVAS